MGIATLTNIHLTIFLVVPKLDFGIYGLLGSLFLRLRKLNPKQCAIKEFMDLSKWSTRNLINP